MSIHFNNSLISGLYSYFARALPGNGTLPIRSFNRLDCSNQSSGQISKKEEENLTNNKTDSHITKSRSEKKLSIENVTNFAKNGLFIVMKSALVGGLELKGTILQFKYIYNNFDFSIDLSIKNTWLRAFSKICHDSVRKVILPCFKTLNTVIPKISISEINFSQILIVASLEELFYRGMIQQVAIPLISKVLPRRPGKILNHVITRVAITSILFALSHQRNMDNRSGIAPQFIGGLLYGTIVEKMNNGLLVAILAHSFFNLGLQMDVTF